MPFTNAMAGYQSLKPKTEEELFKEKLKTDSSLIQYNQRISEMVREGKLESFGMDDWCFIESAIAEKFQMTSRVIYWAHGYKNYLRYVNISLEIEKIGKEKFRIRIKNLDDNKVIKEYTFFDREQKQKLPENFFISRYFFVDGRDKICAAFLADEIKINRGLFKWVMKKEVN